MLPYGNKNLASTAYGKLARHGKTLKKKYGNKRGCHCSYHCIRKWFATSANIQVAEHIYLLCVISILCLSLA